MSAGFLSGSQNWIRADWVIESPSLRVSEYPATWRLGAVPSHAHLLTQVQAMTWGHPVSSGLRHMDYFVSALGDVFFPLPLPPLPSPLPPALPTCPLLFLLPPLPYPTLLPLPSYLPSFVPSFLHSFPPACGRGRAEWTGCRAVNDQPGTQAATVRFAYVSKSQAAANYFVKTRTF